MKLDWPVVYKDILRVKNNNNRVGICTLWTTRDVVQKILEKEDYNVIGNLYSAQGINAILRNILANPVIDTVIIWGSEMSLSGHSLLSFMNKGIDLDRKIIGGRGEIDENITNKAVEIFRKHVKVIDLRGRDKEVLVQTVKELNKIKTKPFIKSPLLFKKSEPKADTLPSEQTGFRVSGETVAQTWLKVINEIYKYGRSKHTRYSQDNSLKEILNLTAVITKEDPDKEYFPDYLPFTVGELKAYYAELMTDREIPGVAYNYGKLLRKDLGVNQVEEVKKLLNKRPDSKKMVMTLVWPEKFWQDSQTSDTPCLTQIYGSVQDKKFFLTAHFRSQDMVHGWPRNTFALRKLQKDIATSAGYEMGPLTMITHSAHMYGDDFKLVENILMDNYEKELKFTPSVHFDFDARGNVVVEVIDKKDALVFDGFLKKYKNKSQPLAVATALKKIKDDSKLIRATLFAVDGGKPIKMWEGRCAQEVAWQITDGGFILLPSHAMYVGMELKKAEECIITGIKYFQDPA